MTIVNRAVQLLDRVSRPRTARAHCDIPCGIYDPHAAQVAALTVIRMVQLIEALPKPADGASPAERDTYTAQISRYTAVKEEHAKICEHELVVLWTDYFKPEHTEKHANLHDVFWKATKLTSTVKQSISMDASQQLLASCQQIAEIFWDTKGVPTRRSPSNQGAAGGEFVYPAAG
jgi:nickel superoxide dismutase